MAREPPMVRLVGSQFALRASRSVLPRLVSYPSPTEEDGGRGGRGTSDPRKTPSFSGIRRRNAVNRFVDERRRREELGDSVFTGNATRCR